jgi:hypothetical protein
MKRIIAIITVFITVLLFSSIAKPQGGTCSDCKSIESQKLYLEKSGNRLLWIQADLFEFRIGDQNSSKKEWSALIKIHSYDRTFNFFNLKGNNEFSIDDSNSVNITVDNTRLQTESIAYFSLRERLVNGEKRGFSGFKPQIKNGKVFDEKGIEVTGTLSELISLKFDLNEFAKFANAKKIKLKIGQEEYKLNADQIKEIILVAQKADSK